MLNVLIVKAMLLGIVWTFGWIAYFAYNGEDVHLKSISIVLAPWIAVLIYFLFFWWG